MAASGNADAVAVLFAGFGSAVDDETVAVFDVGVVLTITGAKTTVNVADDDAASDAIVQLIVPVPPTDGFVQVNDGPEFCVSLTNVVPAGTASVIVTAAAAAGPLFVTVMPKATFDRSGAAVALFAMARSAAMLFAVVVLALFAGLESVVVLLIVAVFATDVDKVGDVCTTSVSVVVAVAARVARMQTIAPVPPTAGAVHE